MFPPKIPLPLRGSSPPRKHTVPRAKPTHHPKRHVDRFSRFRMCSKFYAVQCIVNGEEDPLCPFPLGFRHRAGEGPSHGHRQHAQKFGKDRACGSGDIIADRQTDRHAHTQTFSSVITILRNRCGRRSNKLPKNNVSTVVVICDWHGMQSHVIALNRTVPSAVNIELGWLAVKFTLDRWTRCKLHQSLAGGAFDVAGMAFR